MGTLEARQRPPWWALLLIALLSLVAYLWVFDLPLISDSYVQIRLARDYGPVSGWSSLASDVLYRSRATSLVLTYWTERWFGMDPAAFKWTSFALHILNAWLVCCLGRWRVIGWPVAIVAAVFFAFSYEHQEAVVWYAALPELLVFTFSLAALLAWLLWVEAPAGRWGCYAAALVSFTLALLSKESAVVVVPLLAVLAFTERSIERRWLAAMGPFVALAALYFAGIYAARATHLHFNDAGTFTLGTHFLPVLLRSTVRLFWFWGFVCLAALAVWRAREWTKLLAVAAVWIGITLLPYSFLTYMPFVPSRHTYFASVGLAWVIAAAWVTFYHRFRRRSWVVWTLATVLVVHHCVYLWTRKQSQYVERAWPTEAFLQCVRGLEGRIYVKCFPYDISVAQFAADLLLDRPIHAIPVKEELTEADKGYSIDLCQGDAPCKAGAPGRARLTP